MGKILGLLGAAIAPPAAAFTFLQIWAKAHPVPALLLLTAYEVVVLGVSLVHKFVSGTAEELRIRWTGPLAKSIDEGTRRRLSGFDRRYRSSVLGSLRFVDLKGLATMGFYTPQLDEVFVDVSLVHSDPAKVTSGVLGHPQVDPVRRFIGDLIDKPDPVVLAVIGAPGCGKTTLLRHTALLVYRKRRRRRRRVPVLLYLRDQVQTITEDTALPDLIHRDAPVGWSEQKLRAGACVILLDGLDEVADQQKRREVSDWVERQVTHYPLNDFIITSRPHGYQTAPISGADVVQVRGFTDEQVTRFVRGWYLAFEQRSTGEKSPDVTRRAAKEADDLLERLHHNPALYELTANPLLLTMIANVHKFRGALPGGRVDLYNEICQVLLWRRQEAKKLTSELTGDQKMTLLSGLAFTMMSRHVRDLSSHQVAIELRPFLRRMASAPDLAGFLADMTSSGLLVEREHDLYAFAHLTFQEYLAAHHIREKQLTRLLIDNVNDVWWREATLLHVARTNADPIVQACLDSGTVRALSLAFDCAEQGSELALDLRTELDQLLETVFESKAETPMRSLMIRVVVSRHLREVVRTDQGTRLCVDPVTTRIYQLFLESHPQRTPDGPIGQGAQPIRGVRRDDAEAFVEWVNRVVVEQSFGLPSYLELNSSPLGKKLGNLNPWVTVDGQLFLWRDDDLPRIDIDDLYDDLDRDLVRLFEVGEYAQRIKNARGSSRKTLCLPSSPELRILRLTKPPSASTYEDAIGRALTRAIDQTPEVDSWPPFSTRFRHTFIEVVRDRVFGADITPSELKDLVGSARIAPLTTWGNNNLPDFVAAAHALFSRATPLNAVLAAELRVVAMCLALEANNDRHGDVFRRIAVGVSLLERRADGRLPALETIVLATD